MRRDHDDQPSALSTVLEVAVLLLVGMLILYLMGV